MRQVLASVLLLGSLTGCLGQFSSEHIEEAYHRCLAKLPTLADYQAVQWRLICEGNRRAAYDYRLSASRFVPQLQGDWAASATYKAPAQVIIMP
jgi:hypothetical protein